MLGLGNFLHVMSKRAKPSHATNRNNPYHQSNAALVSNCDRIATTPSPEQRNTKGVKSSHAAPIRKATAHQGSKFFDRVATTPTPEQCNTTGVKLTHAPNGNISKPQNTVHWIFC